MKRTKVQLLLARYFEAGDSLTGAELSYMVDRQDSAFVPIHFHEEIFQLLIITPRKILALWTFPRQLVCDYPYCPDERRRIQRINGRTSPGLPPPLNFLLYMTTTVLVKSVTKFKRLFIKIILQ